MDNANVILREKLEDAFNIYDDCDYITRLANSHSAVYEAKFNGLVYRIWFCYDFWQTAQIIDGEYRNHKPFKHHFVGILKIRPGISELAEKDSDKSFRDALDYIESLRIASLPNNVSKKMKVKNELKNI